MTHARPAVVAGPRGAVRPRARWPCSWSAPWGWSRSAGRCSCSRARQLARRSDAPWLFVVLLPLLLAVVLAEVADGGLDAKAVAVLGVLAAVGAALRPLGGGVAGFEPVFFLLVLAGRALGRGFGFVLGSVTLFASALLTAGVGPWLPFQMLAAGWVGFLAGCLPRATGRAEVALLTAYGAVAGLAYGVLMNLWLWPFTTGLESEHLLRRRRPADREPGPVLAFTLVTSLGFDIPRALTTAALVAVAARPVLLALRRAARRAEFGAVPTFAPADRTAPWPGDRASRSWPSSSNGRTTTPGGRPAACSLDGPAGRLGDIATWLAGCPGQVPTVPPTRPRLLVLADEAPARTAAVAVGTAVGCGSSVPATRRRVQPRRRAGCPARRCRPGPTRRPTPAPTCWCSPCPPRPRRSCCNPRRAADPVRRLGGHGNRPGRRGLDGGCAATRDAMRRGRPLWPTRSRCSPRSGADLAFATGVLLQAAARRTPVVLDGPVPPRPPWSRRGCRSVRGLVARRRPVPGPGAPAGPGPARAGAGARPRAARRRRHRRAAGRPGAAGRGRLSRRASQVTSPANRADDTDQEVLPCSRSAAHRPAPRPSLAAVGGAGRRRPRPSQRRRRGRRPDREGLGHHAGRDPATRPRDPRDVPARRLRRADDHGRPDPPVPDDARLRRVDHRLVRRRAAPAAPGPRDAVMADLFGPKGDRLSVLRQPMGASDFVAGDFYTYDDVPAGETDYAMEDFTIAHDRPRILPLLRQALRLNPDLTVVATPWSPPAWMKTNDSLIGGRLIDDPAIYRRMPATS